MGYRGVLRQRRSKPGTGCRTDNVSILNTGLLDWDKQCLLGTSITRYQKSEMNCLKAQLETRLLPFFASLLTVKTSRCLSSLVHLASLLNYLWKFRQMFSSEHSGNRKRASKIRALEQHMPIPCNSALTSCFYIPLFPSITHSALPFTWNRHPLPVC